MSGNHGPGEQAVHIEIVNPSDHAGPAAQLLRCAWRPPCLYYTADYVRWQLRFPSSHSARAVAAWEGGEMVGFAGLTPRREEVAAAFREWQRTRDERSRLAATEQQKASRAEFLAFQLNEIDKAAPKAGEDEDLSATRQVLANADRLQRLSDEAYASLYEGDHAALPALAAVWKRVGELSALDPKFAPYLETRESVKPQLEDLAFLVGQPLESPGQVGARGHPAAALGVVLDRALDLVQERLAVERLLDELDGTGLHGPDRHGDIGMRRDEDDGHAFAARDQFLEQVEPAGARHPHIEDHATGTARGEIAEKLGGGGECLGADPDRLHEPAQRVPHVRVVIHNVDECLLHRRVCRPEV